LTKSSPSIWRLLHIIKWTWWRLAFLENIKHLEYKTLPLWNLYCTTSERLWILWWHNKLQLDKICLISRVSACTDRSLGCKQSCKQYLLLIHKKQKFAANFSKWDNFQNNLILFILCLDENKLVWHYLALCYIQHRWIN
jgi:hypothetical protein